MGCRSLARELRPLRGLMTKNCYSLTRLDLHLVGRRRRGRIFHASHQVPRSQRGMKAYQTSNLPS
jgi:hypothetical protein